MKYHHFIIKYSGKSTIFYFDFVLLIVSRSCCHILNNSYISFYSKLVRNSYIHELLTKCVPVMYTRGRGLSGFIPFGPFQLNMAFE